MVVVVGKNCFGRSWLDFQYNIVSERILTLRVIDFEGLVYKGMIYWLVDLAGQAGKVGFCGVVATINCVVTQEIWRITRTLLCSAPALLFCKYFSPFCVAIAPILQLRSFQNLSVSEWGIGYIWPNLHFFILYRGMKAFWPILTQYHQAPNSIATYWLSTVKYQQVSPHTSSPPNVS